MKMGRRHALQGAGGMAVMGLAMVAGLVRPSIVRAEGWNKAAFDVKGNLNEAVKALGGSGASESKDIQMTSPDIAENGAVVPFTVTSKLPKTE